MAENNTAKREPTRKERYEILREQLCIMRATLKDALNNEEAVESINKLDELLKQSMGCEDLKDINSILKDIVGSIPAVKTFDQTRTTLIETLDVLDGMIDKILADIAKRELLEENLENIFKLCVEHADEISKIIGVSSSTEI